MWVGGDEVKHETDRKKGDKEDYAGEDVLL
jgi:hypothetical protein